MHIKKIKNKALKSSFKKYWYLIIVGVFIGILVYNSALVFLFPFFLAFFIGIYGLYVTEYYGFFYSEIAKELGWDFKGEADFPSDKDFFYFLKYNFELKKIKNLSIINETDFTSRFYTINKDQKSEYNLNLKEDQTIIRLENTESFMVFEINFPNMDFHHMGFFASKNSYYKRYFKTKEFERIILFDNSDKKYELYCRADSEIEAMQIFKQEFIDLLDSLNIKVNIEINKTKIIIFIENNVISFEKFNKLLQIYNYFKNNYSEIKRLENDFRVLAELKK